MGPGAPPDFPTLAEVLGDALPGDAVSDPVVAVVEDTPPLGLLPEGSAVVTPEGLCSDGMSWPTTLDGLARLVRGADGDVLLVTRTSVLAEVGVGRLAAAIATDSACTSVSAVAGVRPFAPGLPPPAIDIPLAGAVLVRRQDLLLAIDEADRASGSDPAPTEGAPPSLIEQVIRLLDRPGFVHRACGAAADDSPDAPPATTLSRSTCRSSPRILVDGSFLAHPLAGTQVQALALVRALMRGGADVSVLRPGEVHPTVAAAIAATSEKIPLVDRDDAGRPDVFHRMSQVFSLHELADRLVIGERFVLTHQDMIWDRTVAYHVGDARRDYRRATAAALALADHVGFFSLHAAQDAASDGGLELDRATVVPLGVDHLVGRSLPCARAEALGDRPYLLMVGSSFRHKNRLFSLRLMRELVDRGWSGGLVFVGGENGRGSSVPAEQAFVAEHPVLGERVRWLGHVRDDEQLALYRDAELVLFPSLYEGFGFIPFEAAALGTASVYTLRSSMGELLPPDGALPSLDAREAAAFVIRLLEEPALQARIVEAIGTRAATLTWDRTAAGYLEVYERALARPQRPSVPVLRAARELADRAIPTGREALLLDVYRRRAGTRRVVDAAYSAGRAVRRGLGPVRRR